MFSRGRGPTDAIWQREEPVDKAKPFDIPKREVWEAFKRVKANQGTAGVDGHGRVSEKVSHGSGSVVLLRATAKGGQWLA